MSCLRRSRYLPVISPFMHAADGGNLGRLWRGTCSSLSRPLPVAVADAPSHGGRRLWAGPAHRAFRYHSCGSSSAPAHPEDNKTLLPPSLLDYQSNNQHRQHLRHSLSIHSIFRPTLRTYPPLHTTSQHEILCRSHAGLRRPRRRRSPWGTPLQAEGEGYVLQHENLCGVA